MNSSKRYVHCLDRINQPSYNMTTSLIDFMLRCEVVEDSIQDIMNQGFSLVDTRGPGSNPLGALVPSIRFPADHRQPSNIQQCRDIMLN